MPASELTDERKRDLEVLMMRDALDPKSHYKKPDREVFPKYFQVIFFVISLYFRLVVLLKTARNTIQVE